MYLFLYWLSTPNRLKPAGSQLSFHDGYELQDLARSRTTRKIHREREPGKNNSPLHRRSSLLAFFFVSISFSLFLALQCSSPLDLLIYQALTGPAWNECRITGFFFGGCPLRCATNESILHSGFLFSRLLHRQSNVQGSVDDHRSEKRFYPLSKTPKIANGLII